MEQSCRKCEEMKNILVTGATGFIGINLIKLLIQKQHNVFAVVRNEKSDISNLPKSTNIIFCEMDQIENLKSKLSGIELDMCFHLAWAGVNGIDRADYNLQMNNVRNTLKLIQVLKEVSCKRFVGAGTLAEYDVQAYIPIDGSIPNAVAHYGVAKLMTHYMSKIECVKFGIEYVWAYLSNTYGVGNKTNNFINFAIETILNGKDPDFTKGEQLYDFVYISDCVNALYCAGIAGDNGAEYYLGSNHPQRLYKYIEMIRDIVDPSIELNLGAVPFHGVSHGVEVYDCEKLMSHTKYNPEVTFEDGIMKTVQWLKEGKDGTTI